MYIAAVNRSCANPVEKAPPPHSFCAALQRTGKELHFVYSVGVGHRVEIKGRLQSTETLSGVKPSHGRLGVSMGQLVETGRSICAAKATAEQRICMGWLHALSVFFTGCNGFMSLPKK